jgi:hypothetical protein
MRERVFKADLLNDPVWLRRKYWYERLTTYDIANLVGANQNSVMQAMAKHGIETRSISKAARLRADLDLSGVKKTYHRKFSKLEDVSWLRCQYVVGLRTCEDIAHELSTVSQNVYRALRRHGIPTRTNRQAQLLVEHKSKYALLNDATELDRLYVGDKISTGSIAILAGAKSCNSARQALIRQGIQVRNYREAQIHSRFDEGFICDQAVIDGGLLGDASLHTHRKESEICAPCYCRMNKHRDHVLWVAKKLVGNFVEGHVGPVTCYLNDEAFFYYVFYTQTHDSLKPFLARWYPRDNPYDSCKHYTKVIPEDVDISPVSLLHCFLDDGCTYRRRIESPTKQAYAQLCLQGFTRENLEMFCQRVKREYGHSLNIKTRPCYTGYGYLLEISQGSYQTFLDIIGPCPEELVPCMGYKWK